MTPLRIRGKAVGFESAIVGQVTFDSFVEGDILIAAGNGDTFGDVRDDYSAVVFEEREQDDLPQLHCPMVYAVPFTTHLENGDIVVLNPNGKIETLFRVRSPHNALFITDRCNSNCLMCSQPPKDFDDLSYLYDINMQLISLIPKDTRELGITGGEPTLLGNRLVRLFRKLKTELPSTGIHMLTNGRSFAWKSVVESLSSVGHPHVVFGIPLYSDYYAQHDYVVQANDAFAQTMQGLYNLARYDQRIEIRVVLHKQTYKRLPKLADFIYRNLPFVEHVAFMGLEYTGYTPHNDELLWMEPSEYVNELADAVGYLDVFGMTPSIYNLPLCLLPQSLWPFCRKSISDWKRDYLEECTKCSMLDECGGVFATSKRLSDEISAIH